jgi:hypothetical protein
LDQSAREDAIFKHPKTLMIFRRFPLWKIVRIWRQRYDDSDASMALQWSFPRPTLAAAFLRIELVGLVITSADWEGYRHVRLYLTVSDSLRRRESECRAESVGIDCSACCPHECSEQWKALLAEYESQAGCD